MDAHSRRTPVLLFPDGSNYYGNRRIRRDRGAISFGPECELADSRYVGELRDGIPHGMGRCKFSDGRKFVGEFRNGMPEGLGTLTFGPDSEWAGDISKGYFRDFIKNGWGSYDCPEYTYIGNYRDGLKHGSGTTRFTSGHKYVGEFRDDWWNGQGRLSFASGGSYAGGFRNGLMHGKGTRFGGNGEALQEGMWEFGDLVWCDEPYGPVVNLWAPTISEVPVGPSEAL
jgi:hypothetical protein